MNEQRRQHRESDRKVPSFWNCAPFDGSMACGGGINDDADSIVVEQGVQQQQQQQQQQPPPPLPPQQRVRNLVDGFLSPFFACVQPNLQACMAPTTEWEPRQCYPMYSPASNNSHSSRRDSGATVGSASSSAVVLSSAAAVVASATAPSTITRATPNENDVLCGRGKDSTRHPGNQNFRDLIAANKSIYLTLTKKEKMLLARQIVDLILHTTDPPGRFLGRDSATGLWYDIGMPRSLEKTSQALREKSSLARAACGKLQAAGSEIKSVLSSDSTDVASGDSKSIAAEEVKQQATPRTRNGPVEAPPVRIPLHLQNVYGFKSLHHHRQPEHLQPPPPPPPADPYGAASSRQNHHHLHPYSPQLYSQNPPPPPPPPKMSQSFAAPEQGHRHYHQYTNEGQHHYALQQQPQPPPRYSHPASMVSPPRQSQHPSYPVVTPQPPQYQDRTSYERPPPLQNVVSMDSGAPPAFPIEEKSSSSATAAIAASSLFTRERPTSNGKLSPTREQEWKRQRVADKTKRRLAPGTTDDGTINSDNPVAAEQLNTSNESGNSNASTGLTKAIETKLTLEDRVIRSPSSMMQSSISGRRRNFERPLRSIAKEQLQSSLDTSADSSMDGLTALSTAAFLRLDETY